MSLEFKPNRHDSFHIRMFQADVVLSYDSQLEKLIVMKSRYNDHKGEVNTTEEEIDITLNFLCKVLYKDSIQLFQEGLKQDLKKVIEEHLNRKENNLIENTI